MKRLVFFPSALMAILLLTNACSSTPNSFGQPMSAVEVLNAAKRVADSGKISDPVLTGRTLQFDVAAITSEPTTTPDGRARAHSTRYSLGKFSSNYRADGFSYYTFQPAAEGFYGTRLEISFSESICIEKDNVTKLLFPLQTAAFSNPSKSLLNYTSHANTSVMIDFSGPSKCAAGLILYQSALRRF